MPKQLKLVHLIILLCLSVFAFSTYSIASPKDGLLKIYFLDVGQGDAIFIETPNGNQVLVDGGPDKIILEKLGELIPFYDRSIDLVVVSHPHADHISGLIGVLERYEVANILEAKEVYKSPVFDAWQEAVKNEGANEMEAIADQEIDLGNGVVLTIIYPPEYVTGKITSKPHDYVVAVILKYGEFELLLTGDMEEKVEKRLLLSSVNLDSDVLKVGHHGSKTSSSPEFLSAVSPEVAIIQVGEKNRYSHPSSEVLKRLDEYGIRYYRNDIDGDIKIISDGQSYQIVTTN